MPVQIYQDVLAAIRGGRLTDGVALPGSRAAALGLGVSRATINTAYDLLRAEGVLVIRPGASPRVLAPATDPAPETRMMAGLDLSERGQSLAMDARAVLATDRDMIMLPGQPDEALFPRAQWGLALRQAARRLHGTAAAYGALDGLPDLRAALAARLAADRGMHVSPDQILITPGTRASLLLLAQALTQPGDMAVIEDPGYLGARNALRGAGLCLAAVATDAEGLRVGDIPARARLIYTTPSNQYPTGGRMSLARRLALLDHARRHRALVIEDDYDGEFQWRGQEIPALAAHSGGQEVAYLGSASKVLMPGLRLGWLVVPRDLAAPLRAVQKALGLFANLHTQAALDGLIRSGGYRTHLRRIARAYGARGLALAEALSGLPGVHVAPPDGGVQMAVRFVGDHDETAIIGQLRHAGFGAVGLSLYGLDHMPQGVLIGFADATPARIRRFRDVLAKTMAQ